MNAGELTYRNRIPALADQAGKFITVSSSEAVFEFFSFRDTPAILTDGDTITHDLNSFYEVLAGLTTGESAIAYNLSNMIQGAVLDLSVKKTIAGNVTITFDGEGYVFVDMNDDPDTEAALLAITHDGADDGWIEVSLKCAPQLSGENKVIQVVKL
jgi:hypothetical protein